MTDRLPAIDVAAHARRVLADDAPPASIEPRHVRSLILGLVVRIQSLEAEVSKLRNSP